MKDRDLQDRYEKFGCLELPGQPQGMHMGTSYFVSDLVKKIEELEEAMEEIHDLYDTSDVRSITERFCEKEKTG